MGLRLSRRTIRGRGRCAVGHGYAKIVFVAWGLIVVGVDGSEESRAALRWAVEEARLRKAAVSAVHAWWAIPELEPGTPVLDEDWQTLRDQEAKRFVEQFVEHTLGGARAGVEITAVPVQGVTAAVALLEAAKDADLLVVGSRGLGGFKGLLLGSVSQQCTQHAECPVAIIRGASPAGR